MIAVVADVPYTEIAPPRDLAAYVDRFWVKRASIARPQRVLPDGCVDLLVHVGKEQSEIVGPMTRALVVSGGASDVVAVRFKPGAAARFVGTALDALTDRHVATELIGLGEREMVDRVCGAVDLGARVHALEGVVRRRLESADGPDRLVRRAVLALCDPRSGSVDEVAARLGVSRQHLARLVRREVGLTPKNLARVARMQRAVLALSSGRRDFARLALDLGYFDQSHFVNDLVDLTGTTPGRLEAELGSIFPIASVFGAADSAAAGTHRFAAEESHP